MKATHLDPDSKRLASRTRLSASEGAREFFQGRIRLLGKIGVLFTFAYYLLSNISLILSYREPVSVFVTDVTSIVCLVMFGFSLSIWIGCRHSRSHVFLKSADVIITLVYCVLIALSAWAGRVNPSIVFSAGMPVTYAILIRAVLIPSSAARTAWVSTIGYLPLFLVAYRVWSAPDLQWVNEETRPSLILFMIVGLLGAALAAVTSNVIYGLRREVRKARQLGQYQLEEKLGAGSMGEVYRGRHAMLRRPTAIKLLSPDKAGETSIARFEREVQLTSQLTHPNTIAIFDFGRTPDHIFYYAMEFLDGLTLEELIAAYGPQPPDRTIHILEQVCASLSEAHARGLIHRDVKPANLILCERGGIFDFIKVVDFGLVKHITPTDDATISGVNTITGTPLYMSPEAIRTPQAMDARSDLYSVGAVGYFLLTGQRLFDSDNFMEICSYQITRTPERPSVRCDAPIPRDLEGLVMMCLDKDPARRPESALSLRAALAACADARGWTEDNAATWWQSHRRESRPASSSEAETIDAPLEAGGRRLEAGGR